MDERARQLDQASLEAWTRVALDAEAFERSLAPEFQDASGDIAGRIGEHAGHASSPWSVKARSMARVIGFAMAACVTVVAGWMVLGPSSSRVHSPGPSVPGPIAAGPKTTLPPALEGFDKPLKPRQGHVSVQPAALAASPEDHAFVLAVYAPDETGGACNEWRISSVDTGCPLQQLDSADLLKAALALAGTNAPTGLHVIAVSGPAGSGSQGPAGAAMARALQDRMTACIRASQGCAEDSACYLSTTTECLPPGLTIVSESLSRRR